MCWLARRSCRLFVVCFGSVFRSVVGEKRTANRDLVCEHTQLWPGRQARSVVTIPFHIPSMLPTRAFFAISSNAQVASQPNAVHAPGRRLYLGCVLTTLSVLRQRLLPCAT
ncbi:hypothetical protein C8F01DRAFT_120793 [Mycena amicta]|nr:hypothetical protein C8F01DRAFT_120793 [Mycena amicta]